MNAPTETLGPYRQAPELRHADHVEPLTPRSHRPACAVPWTNLTFLLTRGSTFGTQGARFARGDQIFDTHHQQQMMMGPRRSSNTFPPLTGRKRNVGLVHVQDRTGREPRTNTGAGADTSRAWLISWSVSRLDPPSAAPFCARAARANPGRIYQTLLLLGWCPASRRYFIMVGRDA